MPEPSRVQLCGTFAVELRGRRVEHALRGRQGRLLFAYLVLQRGQHVSRDALIDALWGDEPPPSAGNALNALISKARTIVEPDVIVGRAGLCLVLPEPATVDVEMALAAVHAAESAVARGDWRAAWAPALTAHFVARRGFLPEAEAPWSEVWRRRLAEVDVRALESYATACLELGGTELAAAERAARRLIEHVPLRETAHLLLMRALVARGNVAEALAQYEHLRAVLRDELGVSPSPALQETWAGLLR
ncbi:AfsR/SARP family transcriptional regulator [Actinoplanes sp. CA-142083]|uniref:AfsR/SARP family transcriptional regulator n=1 Tax=Actinoplanes sp. CA-142083 TaxID=3239903 RepID=UPI003D8C9908